MIVVLVALTGCEQSDYEKETDRLDESFGELTYSNGSYFSGSKTDFSNDLDRIAYYNAKHHVQSGKTLHALDITVDSVIKAYKGYSLGEISIEICKDIMNQNPGSFLSLTNDNTTQISRFYETNISRATVLCITGADYDYDAVIAYYNSRFLYWVDYLEEIND